MPPSLSQFTTRVVSCRAAELRPEGGGEPVHGFQVVLEDTILFPEGGGQVRAGSEPGWAGPGRAGGTDIPCPQPDDRGLIGDVPVLRVTRRGSEAVHFVPAALEPGAEVLLSLDWERRFDHMQQHSGPCQYRGAPGNPRRWGGRCPACPQPGQDREKRDSVHCLFPKLLGAAGVPPRALLGL